MRGQAYRSYAFSFHHTHTFVSPNICCSRKAKIGILTGMTDNLFLRVGFDPIYFDEMLYSKNSFEIYP
jgi:hypothetical protein